MSGSAWYGRWMSWCWVGLTLIGAAAPLAAQTEVGFDMALQVTDFASSEEFVDLENRTNLSFPAPHIRVAMFVTPQVAIEPRVGFTYSASGGASVSTTQVVVSGYYHFPRINGGRAAFVRMGAGASILGGSAVSDTQMLTEAGVGIKLPSRDRLLFRLEGFLGRAFESDRSRASTRLGASVGVSWLSGP
ncbi:MAG: hypothetical protein HKN73_06230 [Gemmatimonadetes bacterium]|nr:hypothetical protein [Gemmatimonadota bacterium]